MSSQSAKVVQRVFSDAVTDFETDNIVLQQTMIRSMGGEESNRNLGIRWYPKPAIGVTTDGLDLAGTFQDFTNLSIPEKVDTYTSYQFSLSNTDTLDEFELRMQIKAGMQAISARVNRAVANVVYQQGALAITTANGGIGVAPTAIKYAGIAAINSLFTQNDIDITTQKTLVMNTVDYKAATDDLATRQTLNKGTIPEGAYKEAFVARIAALKVFETAFTPSIGAQAASITVNGASQNVIPVAFQLTPSLSPENVDNRSQNLVVSSTAGIIEGDAFTMADVNEVSMINKEPTGFLRTFTVKSIVNGTTLEISPQIVVDPGTLTSQADKAQRDYANVTQAPANLAAITFLNTTATKSNLFWENDSIVLNVAPVVGSQDKLGGLILENLTTGGSNPGLNFILAKQGSIDDLSSKWRITTFFGANNREPEKNGKFITGQ